MYISVKKEKGRFWPPVTSNDLWGQSSIARYIPRYLIRSINWVSVPKIAYIGHFFHFEYILVKKLKGRFWPPVTSHDLWGQSTIARYIPRYLTSIYAKHCIPRYWRFGVTWYLIIFFVFKLKFSHFCEICPFWTELGPYWGRAWVFTGYL